MAPPAGWLGAGGTTQLGLISLFGKRSAHKLQQVMVHLALSTSRSLQCLKGMNTTSAHLVHDRSQQLRQLVPQPQERPHPQQLCCGLP